MKFRKDLWISSCVTRTGLSGRALADKILEALQEYGLDVGNIRSEAYDGAGNMAEKCRGAAACIQSACPTVLHIH